MADLCLPLCAGEDTFELNSVQLELEAVERRIHELLGKQAQLRKRKATLEKSRADAHKSGVSMQRAANTPTTSTPCVSLHRPRAPGTRSSQMAFTPAPGNHGPWVQQRKTRSRPRATTSPPPVFDISSRNRFAPLCETDRDAVVIGDSIVRHVRATLAEGKVHTHCLPGAWCFDQLMFLMFLCRYPRSWRMTRALQLLWFTRGLTTPSCGRRRHWRGTSGAWSRWYAAHRPRRRSSCQDLFPRIDEDTESSVDCLL